MRDAEPRDADAIAAVHVAAWHAAYRGLMPDEFLDGITVEGWSARWRTLLGGDEAPAVLLAVGGGGVIGFCILATPSRDEDAGAETAEVVALNVNPEAWRSGVGTALMAEALKSARRDGWRSASLWVLEGNQRALEFYRHLGFVLDGSSKVHEPTGTRELRMRLPLTDEPEW